MGVPTDHIAYYKMDSVVGNVLVDETGNYSGTITGTTQVTGVVGQALDFNGSSDKVSNFGLSSVVMGALSFWFNAGVEINASTTGIAAFGLFSTKGFLQLGATSGSLTNETVTVGWYDGVGGDYRAIDTVIPAGWNHIVVNYDGVDNVDIYVNSIKGTNQNGGFGTAPARDRSLTSFEMAHDNIPAFGNLSLDETRVYDRALTQPEIDTLYAEVFQVTSYLLGSVSEIDTVNPLKNTVLSPVSEINILKSLRYPFKLSPVSELDSLSNLNFPFVLSAVSEIDSLKHLLFAYKLSGVTETNYLKSIINNYLAGISELDSLKPISHKKTTLLGNLSEIDALQGVTIAKAILLQGLIEQDLLNPIVRAAAFHELQKFDLSVNMLSERTLNIVIKKSITGIITFKDEHIFNITTSKSTALGITTTRPTDLGA